MSPDREQPEPLSPIEQKQQIATLQDNFKKVLHDCRPFLRALSKAYLWRQDSAEMALTGLPVIFEKGEFEYNVSYDYRSEDDHSLFIMRRRIGLRQVGQWEEDLLISVVDDPEEARGSSISYHKPLHPPHDNDTEAFQKYTEFLNDLSS